MIYLPSKLPIDFPSSDHLINLPVITWSTFQWSHDINPSDHLICHPIEHLIHSTLKVAWSEPVRYVP